MDYMQYNALVLTQYVGGRSEHRGGLRLCSNGGKREEVCRPMTERLPTDPAPGALENYAESFDDLFGTRAQCEALVATWKGEE